MKDPKGIELARAQWSSKQPLLHMGKLRPREEVTYAKTPRGLEADLILAVRCPDCHVAGPPRAHVCIILGNYSLWLHSPVTPPEAGLQEGKGPPREGLTCRLLASPYLSWVTKCSQFLIRILYCSSSPSLS